MALVINSNLSSLSARNQLGSQVKETNQAMERLTTGKRINTAADDAAGLQVASKMTTAIRSAQMATRNANDAISFAQVAEGSLDVVSNSLQRIRELTIQAANETNNSSNLISLQAEASQLIDGIDDTLEQATFNNINVFGDLSKFKGNDAIEIALETFWVPESEMLIERYYGLTGKDMNLSVNISNIDGAGGALASVSRSGVNVAMNGAATSLTLNIDTADFSPPNLPNGGTAPFYNDRIIAHEMVHAVMAANMNLSNLPAWFLEGTAEFIHGADERVKNDLAIAGSAAALIAGNLNNTLGVSPPTSAEYSVSYIAAKMLHDEASQGMKGIMDSLATGSTFDQAIASNTGYTNAAAFEAYVTANGASYITSEMDIYDQDTGSIQGSDHGGRSLNQEDVLANIDTGDRDGDFTLTDLERNTRYRQLDVSLGKGDEQQMSLDYSFLDSGTLGVKNIDIAETVYALEKLDFAIEKASSVRADYGIMITRLESNINRLSSTVLNTSDARSRIMDADYANEAANLSRSQVLQQASQAMLAQANSQPQEVLSLLNG